MGSKKMVAGKVHMMKREIFQEQGLVPVCLPLPVDSFQTFKKAGCFLFSSHPERVTCPCQLPEENGTTLSIRNKRRVPRFRSRNQKELAHGTSDRIRNRP
jgi:hypothetical protein